MLAGGLVGRREAHVDWGAVRGLGRPCMRARGACAWVRAGVRSSLRGSLSQVARPRPGPVPGPVLLFLQSLYELTGLKLGLSYCTVQA